MSWSKKSLYLRGVAMGAADIVPGVSGGTVAFVTGIYDELLRSINACNLGALHTLFRGDISAFWQRVNGTFLLCVVAGVATSLFTLAHLLSYCLAHHPVLLWSFFFGLVVASIAFMYGQLGPLRPAVVAALLIGAQLSWAVTAAIPGHWPTAGPVTFFVAGSLAICAMILPGLSGSFILVVMGLYGPVLEAVKRFDFLILACFAAGCITGIALFARLLALCLSNYRSFTLALLTGLMAGALRQLWPWKTAATIGTGQSTAPINLWPGQYEQMTGEPAHFFVAIALAILACVIVGLFKLAASRQDEHGKQCKAVPKQRR